MTSLLTTRSFDLIACSLAAASVYCRWDSKGPSLRRNLFRGLQGFALTAAIDHLARLLLPSNVRPDPQGFVSGFKDAVIEELLYAGILSTKMRELIALPIPYLPFTIFSAIFLWPIVFIASLSTGQVAARAVFDIPENASLPTLDVKIGVCWAIFREVVYQLNGPNIDSLIFAVGHLEPLKAAPLSLKVYKGISALFFRSVANHVAYKSGFVSALAQHVLFNFSRSLPY